MSVFSKIPEADWIADNDLAFAVYPIEEITDGHTLVITRRVTPNWLTATQAERDAVMELVTAIMNVHLSSDRSVRGFNVGFNVGAVAGQTVNHLHVHVVPRRLDEQPERNDDGFMPLLAKY